MRLYYVVVAKLALAACLAVAMLLAACGEDVDDPRTTVRIGTTTSVSAVAPTTVRPVDRSTAVSGSTSASSSAGSTTSSTRGTAVIDVPITADVAGWHQVELGVPGAALLDGRLAFDEDKAAWAQSTLGHDDVFVLDLHTGITKKVTDSREQVTAIALDGSRLVWVARDSSDLSDPATLMLYDLDTGKRSTVAEAPIPPGYMIQVVGDHIAWCQVYADGEGGKATGRLALFVYSISSGSTAKVSDRLVTGAWEANGRSGFDLDGSHIAYIETANLNTDGEVWLYDLGKGSKLHLAHSVASSNHVSLQDDLVAWASAGKTPRGALYPASDVSVYRIRNQASEKIATIFTPEPIPQTDGRYVVWDDYVGDASFNVRVIKGYDSKKDKVFEISQNGLLNFAPEIFDGLVVWERGGELDSEIMARDLATGQTTQLSADASMDQIARVHGRTVVWLKHWASAEDGAEIKADASVIATAPERLRDAFSDVPGSYRYRTAVQAMFDWGLATGVKIASDRQYHPEEGLPRTEYLQMVSTALELGAADGSSLTDGGDGTAALTRAQAVSIVMRALDQAYPGMTTADKGRPPGAAGWDGPYEDDLERAYAGHVLSSLIDWLQPWDASQLITRAEGAQLIYNAVMLALETNPEG